MNEETRDTRHHPPDPPALPNPSLLRATQAYLLPRSLRQPLEALLGEVAELSRDEGMHELREHPVGALGRAILEDLEAVLAMLGELEQLVRGGSTGSEELRIDRAVRSVGKVLTPQLREMDRELRPCLDRLAQALGETP